MRWIIEKGRVKMHYRSIHEIKVGDVVRVVADVNSAKLICGSSPGWAGGMEAQLNTPLTVLEIKISNSRVKLSGGYWWPICVCMLDSPFRKQLKGESDTQYKVCRKVIKMEKQHASRNISV
jgi:hypothetical protein